MPAPVTQPEWAGWAGVAREDITPTAGIYARNWGAAAHDTAQGVHRPLTATALTLALGPNDDAPLVLVALDLGWWRSRGDEWSVRGPILDALDLPPANLMLCLSHTHAGPTLSRDETDAPGGELVGPYLDRVRDAVILAVRRARERAEPATLSWAWGRCDLARNRDLPDREGPRLLCGYHPDGPADDTLLVGRVTGADGRTRATLVNYACHPVTLAWENALLSPDYVGAMREVVEAHTSAAPCLFLQGASGELAPREQYVGDVGVADAHGRRLGWAALSALEGMLPPQTQFAPTGVIESGAVLATWGRAPRPASRVLEARCVDVPLALKPSLPTAAEIEGQLASCDDRVQAERLRRRLRQRRSVGDGPDAPMPLWVWRVGDGLLLGQPNEAYSHWQTELRRRFPAQAVCVMNVVNGHFGYLPPAALYDQDAYPVWQTPFDRGGLEQLRDVSRQTIEALLQERTDP